MRQIRNNLKNFNSNLGMKLQLKLPVVKSRFKFSEKKRKRRRNSLFLISVSFEFSKGSIGRTQLLPLVTEKKFPEEKGLFEKILSELNF